MNKILDKFYEEGKPQSIVIDTFLTSVRLKAYNILGISSCLPLTIRYVPGVFTWEISTPHEGAGNYTLETHKHLGLIYAGENKYEVWAKQLDFDEDDPENPGQALNRLEKSISEIAYIDNEDDRSLWVVSTLNILKDYRKMIDA